MGESACFARRTGHIAVVVCLSLLAWAGAAPRAFADGATRELPDHYGPDTTLTVTITIDPPDPPANPLPAGLEDTPPVGWVVSNISDGGTWDAQLGKVKWGPFFVLPIPEVVNYDVTPPASVSGAQCFTGIASFGITDVWPITGDQCIAIVVPTLSEWGLAVMALLVVMAGAIVIRKKGSRSFSRSCPVVPPLQLTKSSLTLFSDSSTSFVARIVSYSAHHRGTEIAHAAASQAGNNQKQPGGLLPSRGGERKGRTEAGVRRSLDLIGRAELVEQQIDRSIEERRCRGVCDGLRALRAQ